MRRCARRIASEQLEAESRQTAKTSGTRYLCQRCFDVYACSGCGRRALVLHAEVGVLPSPATHERR